MDPVTLYAALTGEPFLLTLDEIGGLTDWQIERIYGHARDKKTGQVQQVEQAPKGRMTLAQRKAQFFTMGRALRVPQADLEKTWAEKYGSD
jgi:hypothetical protein